MYSEERKRFIADQITAQDRVQVSALSQTLHVSEVTIRRDLAEMERDGLLKRTFGGAVSLTTVKHAEPYAVKRTQQLAAKQSIGQRAVQFIADEMTIFIDAGTTTAELAQALTGRHLTVVTVDLHIALALSEQENVEVYVVGGQLSNKSKATNSIDTIAQIEQFHFDLAFIGCDAFDFTTLETDTEVKAALKAAAIHSASLAIVLADASKFNTHSLRNFATLSEVSYLVSDPMLNHAAAALPECVQDKVIIGGS
ncbi:MAG: DeoR/GlpR family DNA-binding transcription regulator [Lactobacillus sp.]|jgi:DeoR/GlpR family transcriptional regulator of sugar metabolism|nr:DeoR/GlpR family DNA-binding transcription regulator [Lactobacillus sp.]MCI2033362.1 DeoR/GlpR family DNA-binding transcription regulator [Lactobacillus sp.]